MTTNIVRFFLLSIASIVVAACAGSPSNLVGSQSVGEWREVPMTAVQEQVLNDTCFAHNETRPASGCQALIVAIAQARRNAEAYAALDKGKYLLTVTSMYRGLIDRDTAPGAEPEDLMKLDIPSLIIPGNDDFHATSAARYLHECLAGSEYWDVPVDEQEEENAPRRVLEFLNGI